MAPRATGWGVNSRLIKGRLVMGLVCRPWDSHLAMALLSYLHHIRSAFGLLGHLLHMQSTLHLPQQSCGDLAEICCIQPSKQ